MISQRSTAELQDILCNGDLQKQKVLAELYHRQSNVFEAETKKLAALCDAIQAKVSEKDQEILDLLAPIRLICEYCSRQYIANSVSALTTHTDTCADHPHRDIERRIKYLEDNNHILAAEFLYASAKNLKAEGRTEYASMLQVAANWLLMQGNAP